MSTKKKTTTSEQFTKVEERVTAQAARPENEVAAEIASRKATLDRVGQLKPDDVVLKFAGLQGQLVQLLNNAQGVVTTNLGVIKDLDAAITAKTEELNTLFDKEVVLRALAELVADFKTKAETLIQEHEDERRRLERELTDTKSDMARDTAALKDAFARLDTDLKQAQERQKAEWAYNFKVECEKQQALFTEQVRKQKIEEDIRKAAVERDLTTRQQAMAAQEKELTDLRARITTLPTEFETAKAQAAAETKKSLDASYNIQISNLKKDAEAAAKIAAIEISSRDATIARLTAELTEAKQQIKDAVNANQNIAQSVANSLSGQTALSALQQYGANGQNAPGGVKKS